MTSVRRASHGSVALLIWLALGPEVGRAPAPTPAGPPWPACLLCLLIAARGMAVDGRTSGVDAPHSAYEPPARATGAGLGLLDSSVA